jgi:acetyl-CoA synthetase
MVLHPKVAEAAVVGYPHPIKGEGIYVYVTVKQGVEQTEELLKELNLQCRKEIGAFATPDVVHWAPALPKTRSGKIMRRLLRDIAAGRDSKQDTTTLEDFNVLAALRGNEE